MRTLLSVVVGASCLMAVMPGSAHHSFSAEFDIRRPVAFTGTTTRVEWTNPHAWLFVETEDAEGNAQIWAVELLGINSLMQRGLTHNSIKPGDVISVEGFVARDGTNTANASEVTMADTGEEIWASAPADRN
jgi:hypothetical protein